MTDDERERRWNYSLAEAKGARWAAKGFPETVEALQFLRRYGAAGELRGWVETAHQLLRTTPWGALDPDDARTLQCAFTAVGPQVDELVMVAEEIEADLREAGYEYEAKSRMLRRVREQQQRGRLTRDLFSEEVEREYYRLREEGFQWAQEGAKPRNGVDLRSAIAASLEDSFHPELLDIGSGGAIKSALDNHIFQADRH